MIDLPLLLALATTKIWYCLPLLVSVSLVYAATRHELLGPILSHAIRFALWIVVFMGIVFGIVYLMQNAV
jgi:hypothetical protein